MATLATQDIPLTNAALTPAYAAAAGGGDNFTPDDRTFLHVKNGDSSSHTVTIATPGKVAGININDIIVTVAAGTERMVGPFPAPLFADGSNSGLAAITYSAVTGVTIAVLRAKSPY